MSLLDDEDEPFVGSSLQSTTREPLYDERTECAVDGDDLPFRAKDKKDKRKLDDRRSSAKALPWSKSSAEKTPKKSRHHRTKSGSPPPVSPKGRGQDAKKQAKGSSQLYPSPNVKSQRKRYVQLGIEAGSSSEGEVDLEGDEGFLLTNQPVVNQQHEVVGSSTSSIEGPKIAKGTSFFDQETSEARADAWWPQPSQPTAPPTLDYTPGGSLEQRDIAEAFLPHTAGRNSVQATTNPLLGELGAFPHQSTSPQPSTFAPSASMGPSLLPVVSSVATGSQPWPPQDSIGEPDWTISSDLRQKCVQQFNDLRPTEGLLQGGEARQFFVQSKLPNQELSAIWRLSDTDKDNALSEAEFCIAMKLVLMRRKGFDIPSALPDSLQPKSQLAEKKVVAIESTSGANNGNPVVQPTPEHSTIEHQPLDDDILVDIGNGDSDTGLLVDIHGTSPPSTSPPPVEPAVARIISIDQTWAGDDDSEDTALVSAQDKSTEEPTSPSRQKPMRPAPPKPSIRRAKTVKEKPNLPPRPSERSLSPPANASQSLIIIDSRQKSKSVRVSGSGRSPGTSRKDYTILGDSASAQDPDGPGEDRQAASHVRWKNSDLYEEKQQNGAKERDKGHARSTSLDLNKMLLADGNSDELEGVPSAEPPKPPPKPLLRALNASEHEDSSPRAEECLAPRGRVRALSTGSIVHEEPMDIPTDALLFSLSGSKPEPPPKPMARRKAPLVPPTKPQRPPPPSKNTAELLHTKDKSEIQAHIRSLKENNSALAEINGHLEDKLFKLIEERVRLAKQLKELQKIQLDEQQEDDHQQ